jgi:hypothetical protein
LLAAIPCPDRVVARAWLLSNQAEAASRPGLIQASGKIPAGFETMAAWIARLHRLHRLPMS